MKYINYLDLEIVSSRTPENTHLLFETSTGGLYLAKNGGIVGSHRIWYSANKGETWSQIDVDPGNRSADEKSRMQKIRSGWHDRANKKIWFVGCYNPGLERCSWTLDYTSSESNPTVVEVSYRTSSPAHYIFDVFMIGTVPYAIGWQEILGFWLINIFRVNADPWVLEDSTSTILNVEAVHYVVVIGTTAYILISQSTNNLLFYSFTSAGGLSALDTETGYKAPRTSGVIDRNMMGLTYDGNNLIQFIAYKNADGKNYIGSYSISTDTITMSGTEQNIALMLDRNTVSGVFEKAYHITDFRVFQIGYNKLGLYKIFDQEPSSKFIIAISDNFIFVNNSGTINIWEYTDISDKIKEVIIDTKTGQISTADVITTEKLATGLTIKVFDDSDNLQFTGAAYKRNSKDGKEFTYKCVGYDKEISRKYTASFTSKTAKEIMQYILDGDTNGDGTAEEISTSFLYYSNSIDNDGSFTATYTLSFKNKTIKHIYDTLMDFENGEWFVAPDGKVYAYALADIPASGETITQASNKIYGEPPDISQMMWELNKISLYGAIVAGARLQNEAGYGEDVASQQVNGINEFLRHYPHVNVQATLNTLADAILARTGLTNNPIYVIVSFKEIGFEQVGKTLNFQFTPYVDLVNATDYYILSQRYYAKEDIATLVLSSGIIQEGREHEATLNQTSDADEEQIDVLTAVAIKVDTSGEINDLTLKSTLVSADVVLIEDSEASYAKKKALISSISGSSDAYGENLTERIRTATTYGKMKEIEAIRAMGTIIISWEQKCGTNVTEHRAKVYVNGVAKSAAYGSNSQVWTTYTYEFTEGIADGDLVQIYGLVYTLGREIRIKNMRIGYSWLANASY